MAEGESQYQIKEGCFYEYEIIDEENKKLNSQGYKSTRPNGWKKAYKMCKIKPLSKKEVEYLEKKDRNDHI